MDRQTAPRSVGVPPSRIGLTGVETVVRLGVDQRSAQLFSARVECVVEPDPARPAALGSRFEEVVTDVVRVAALLAIVDGAMSSEIFELMKRSDEAAVVERAHRRPRAVDDCVRAMITGVVERFADLPDAAFVSAEQESTEIIHRHHLTAERARLLGQLRTGEPVVPRPRCAGWLEADGR